MTDIAPDTPNGKDGQVRGITIRELAREFDVSLRTLRFYEDKGLLVPTRRGMSRRYHERDRERLAAILKGKQLGFTLTEIRAMLPPETRSSDALDRLSPSAMQISRRIAELEARKAEIERAIAELTGMREAAIRSLDAALGRSPRPASPEVSHA